MGKKINRGSLVADLQAGITGAVVVLPQGIAYAMIAGLPPEYGLYTAIITPVVAGLFGSSLHLISGPTAAISIVVLSVVSNIVPPESSSFIPTVLLLTFVAGLIQLSLGVVRLGTLVNFISHTVVIGFTAGAAILIASSQVKYLFPADVVFEGGFIGIWLTVYQTFGELHFASLIILLTTITTAVISKHVCPKLPGMLVGMIAGSLVYLLLGESGQNVQLVGALSSQLPAFAVPDVDAQMLSALLPGAFAVALLGLVEAVSIARAIAIKSGQRIDGNQEFIGQGLSNITGSFFSCYVGSGSFTRSGLNYEAGARTPLAAIFAASSLVFILLYIPTITAFLPLPAVAGAILLIAWGLIDFKHISQILRSNLQEVSVLLVTFLATLTIALEFSIYLGVMLSLILYLRRTSTPAIITVAPRQTHTGVELRNAARFQLSELPNVKIIRIDGSIFLAP